MNAISRRIAAATALVAAPVLIALGAASTANAQAPVTGGQSISASVQQFGPMPERAGRSAHSSIHHRENRPIHQNAMTSSAR
ncbi:hypothetical protein [Mycobacterium sp. ACS4331]|uniref:hypothetical protein n=1 Tax=Mycobacterium sp. ACS4331 TaxID=1834121 RepID=UPI0008005886|nr:hypothetical protein [Mycobacterium sp. ACS4331]OBF30155.1 hypothetical protein A5727_22595 [Mycobacterium sp. ACS4331]